MAERPDRQLEIVTPRKVARGQEWYTHLRVARVDLGEPPALKAICGSYPASGWNTTDRIGKRCTRCDERAVRWGLVLPVGWRR